MYNQHVPQIRNYCLESPDNMARMVEFVLATIQQSISQVPMILDDIDKHGSDSVFLFGSKRDGYNQLHENKNRLYDQACGLFDPVEAIVLFSSIKGIGVVKAGFCAQLLGLPTGCIDSHNLVRHGINPNAVNVSDNLKPTTRIKRIHNYVDLTIELGGAVYLWDSWCNYVAGNRSNKSLVTGEHVSQLHMDAICI